MGFLVSQNSLNNFFPLSKTTYLRNEITTFYQKPNETFNEAWERFKGLLRQCPHHGFSELHQLDTFYNSLNTNDQDALDSAAGGNFLDKMPRDGLAIIESKSKVRYSRSRAIEPRKKLVYYADKSEKNKDKNFVHAISVIDFSKADPFSGSTTNTLPPSSSLMKTSDNFEKFADELAPLDSLPPGNDDSTLEKDFHKENFQVYSNPLFEFDNNFKTSNINPLFEEEDSIPPGINLNLPSTFEFPSSNPTSLTLTGEKDHSWKMSINEDKVFKPGILVYHANHDKNLVTLEENSKENISSGTLLFFKKPSFLLPPPEPPDDFLNFEPNLVMKNVMLNEDFYQSKKTLPLNVEDVNSFAFVIWTFLPYFTYTEESPLFISFRSEDFIFDPGIVTFHFSYLKPLAFSRKFLSSTFALPKDN
ncbi:reverse transcriptase domain-containing protein [Tanacetum coccineum]